MTTESFQYPYLLGIGFFGPIGIIIISLSILTMCLWKLETNMIKPEPLITESKEICHFRQNMFSGQYVQRLGLMDYSCTSKVEKNGSSNLWIKSIKSSNQNILKSSHRLQKELNLLLTLHHTNINPLIGAVVEDSNLYLLSPCCNQGSLQDFLSDNSLTFKKTLIISLIQDLICGLAYIHHSSIKCHGRLKSSNCLVNSCLRLKVADCGANRLRELTSKNASTHSIDRLWLAPELLRDENYDGSSKQADIYAFSIIVHEIVHREGPFNINTMHSVSIDWIIEQVKQIPRANLNLEELFRPKIKDDVCLEFGCPTYVRRCLEDCWHETVNMRPSIDDVFCRLSHMRNEMSLATVKSYLDDGLLALQKDKQKKLRLLHNIIPCHAANGLVKGLRIKPQIFESVTLLFINIDNFRQISETSSPHEHVRMLNDLYKIMDSIVQDYQVYKVETVKDTYFVASGLFLQEKNHSAEAAYLALSLLNSLQNYKISHTPHLPVFFRIGMHSGAVAAGVIGLDKPRFCLFGDAVNMTSRLSTTGLPSRIHISSECYLILLRIGGFSIEKRGQIYLKGKGWVQTYWLKGMDSRSVT